jgi:hypothetical protein
LYKIRQLHYVQKKFKIYILSIASHLHVRWEASNLWVTILLRERGQNVELNFVKKRKKSLSQIFFADCIWGLTSSKSFLKTQLIYPNLAPSHPQSIHSSLQSVLSFLNTSGLKRSRHNVIGIFDKGIFVIFFDHL